MTAEKATEKETKRAPKKVSKAAAPVEKEAKKAIKKVEKKATPAKKPAAKKTPKSDEFAVIETGGKQYVVAVGDILTIEKLPKDFKEGEKVTFENVLLVDNGKDATTVGTPYISGAKVTASFVEEGKGKKINVIKFKSKSRYMKKYGHRQPFTKVKIEALK